MPMIEKPDLNEKPDFKALAKNLCEDPVNMIYTILLRHKTAELEEWYEQIQQRNARIRELENLLNRAAVYVTAEAKDDYYPPRDKAFARILTDDINEALAYRSFRHHDKT